MSRRSKTVLCSVVLLGIAAAASAFLTIGRELSKKFSGSKPITDAVAQNTNSGIRTAARTYVRRGQLSPRLVAHLNALGNRLEKPGNERLTITGVLQSSASSVPRDITATLEFPNKLRLLLGNGPQSRLITSDGQQTKAPSPLVSDELELIETLAYDSADHFFAAQMEGKAMRFLGARFRTDDGSASNYTGPYYDIYKVADRIESSGEERPAKLYYFNSDTLLLERVTYVANRNGSETNVETSLGDWQQEAGQRTPRRIERFENGNSVFVLTIRSVQPGPKVADGTFVQ